MHHRTCPILLPTILLEYTHRMAKRATKEVKQSLDPHVGFSAFSYPKGELQKVASSWVHSILADAGAANDNSWILLPYLCAAFMVSNIWNGAVYDVNIGGLSNNLHCLARCVSAVIGGSEYTRVEREQRINSLSNVHTDELQEAELPSRVSAEANIKSCMQIYVKLSAGIVLDSWNDTS
ncbi:hypothetical protein ACJX0J_039078, partial [Zea mays]